MRLIGIAATFPLVILCIGCGGGSYKQPAAGATEQISGAQADTSSDVKVDEAGYVLRNKTPPTVGTILRIEKFYKGSGTTLIRQPITRDEKVNINREEEITKAEIWEAEATVVNDGVVQEMRLKCIEDESLAKEKSENRAVAKNIGRQLKGETLLGKLNANGDWNYTLVGKNPTDGQKSRMDSKGRKGPEMYLDRKVKPGDSWKISAGEMSELTMKLGIDNAAGEADLTFEKVGTFSHEKYGYNKEPIAVIKVRLKLKGTVVDGGKADVELDSTATVYRSLTKLIDVQEVSYIRIKGNGTLVAPVGELNLTASEGGDETVFRYYK